MHPVLDTLGRPLRNLRLSVTDRCNLRCGYCMPEENYTWLPKADLMRFEEWESLVRELLPLGLKNLRLTGGEPLLRRDLPDLVSRLRAVDPGLDLAMTTNAVRLRGAAKELREAGLDRLTLSLDTLRADRFQAMTRRDELAQALDGIEAAREAGFSGTKLNTVVLRGENDDELLDLLDFGAKRDIEIRFIEYMDVGGATRWSMDTVVPATEILRRIGEVRGMPEPLDSIRTSAPADRFVLPDGQVFGVIASTTRPFCAACDRARMTADGRFFSCLYAREGTAVREVLRSDGPKAAATRIGDVWRGRDDRGAEKRLAESSREALASADELRDTPHLEMHTRGG